MHEDDIDLFGILGRCLHSLLLGDPEHRADWYEVDGEEGAGPDVRGEGAPDVTTLYGVAGILPRSTRQRLSAALDAALAEEGSSVSWASGSPETARDLRLIDHALRERARGGKLRDGEGEGEGEDEGEGEGEGEGAKRQRRGDSPPGDSSPDSVRIKPTLVSIWGEDSCEGWRGTSWTRVEILVALGRPRRRSAFT